MTQSDWFCLRIHFRSTPVYYWFTQTSGVMVSGIGMLTAGKGEQPFRPSQLHVEKDTYPQAKERLEKSSKIIYFLIYLVLHLK